MACSFVENKKPNDLDIVTFLFRPGTATTTSQLSTVLLANPTVFDRTAVKTRYFLDAFFIDLNRSPETIVSVSRYFFGLFSHRRGDDLWKGMLQVSLNNVIDDTMATVALTRAVATLGGGQNP